MANQSQGDGRAVNWSFPLPPKSPAFPSSASGPVLESTAAGRSSVVAIHGGVHKRNPSAGYLSQTQSTWVDELVDAPEGPFKRGSHRRSASESMVFLDGHTSLAKVADEDITEDEEFDSQRTASMHSRGGSSEFDRLDEDQLTSMFENASKSVQKQQQHQANNNPQSDSGVNAASAGCSSPGVGMWTSERGPITGAKPDKPSTPSDSNSLSEASNEEVRARGPEMLRGEPEVQSTRDGDRFSQPFSNGELQQALAGLDSTIDVKRAKRILANRQSAQRSRVRKLQYISELERSVTALQAEITAMAPQVAFYEHRRAILNMDNNTIKQKMAAILQGQLFKDAHNEGLKTELQRLRQLYQQQQLQQPQQQTTPSPGYECQQQEFNNLDLGASHHSDLNMVESDAFPAGLMNSSGEQPICDGSDILSPTLSYSRSLPHGLNGMMPTSCMLPGNGKSLEGMMMGEYMVHNS
ncbi:unnamed protein product [Sphagnum jensenii]|uniref:BZIP domain-containing protein n=1 Tax=Sphagnum jensenii TaxID=128206 RepID=A0ABP1A515_9BRYO